MKVLNRLHVRLKVLSRCVKDTLSLHLNESKTKDMVNDFRLIWNEHDAWEIVGELVERVSDYKYLGVTMNDKLDWSVHAQNVVTKVNQSM